MKRFLALLIAVIIPAALIFTGCGSKKEMTPQDQLFPSILLELIKELKAEVG